MITDFDADGDDHDVLDLSRLFLGQTGDVRDYLSLRFEVAIAEDEPVLQSVLSIRLSPEVRSRTGRLCWKGVAWSRRTWPGWWAKV